MGGLQPEAASASKQRWTELTRPEPETDGSRTARAGALQNSNLVS